MPRFSRPRRRRFTNRLRLTTSTLVLGGMCLGTTADAPAPWYHRPALWHAAAGPFTDQNNVFGLTGVASRSMLGFADLVGDAALDALVGGEDGNFRLFENVGGVGSPAFSAPVTNPFGLTAAAGSAAPALADLDNDGDLDLLSGTTSGDFQLFTNTSAGSTPAFAAPLTNPIGLTGVTNYYSTPAFVDIDDDGDVDVVTGEGYGRIFFFENTDPSVDRTNPGFVERVGAANPFDGIDAGQISAPTFVDYDDDGDFDLFIGNVDGETLLVVNTGNAGSPAFDNNLLLVSGLDDVGRFSGPAFADLDNDNDFDVFVAEGTGLVNFFENTGSAASAAFNFAMPNPLGQPDLGYLSNPLFADIDGDGDLDAFVGEQGSAIGVAGRIFFLENSGGPTTPAFQVPVENPFGIFGVGSESVPTMGDFDGDGDLDLLTGDAFGNFRFFENTDPSMAHTSPGFDDVQINPFGCAPGGVSDAAPAFGDLDGDGDLDLLVGGVDGSLRVFENTGNATAPACDAPQTNPLGLSSVGTYSVPTLADLDGDGDLDALVGSADGLLVFFENTDPSVAQTSPGFVLHTGTDNPLDFVDVGMRSAPTIADIDSDGDLDVFSGVESGDVRFFQNEAATPLPVELSAFTARADGDAVLLRWATASERDNAGFFVEHQAPAAYGQAPAAPASFVRVGFVEGHGTTATARSYRQRIDALAPGHHRFRLRQMDYDGRARLSAEVEVTVELASSFELSPAYPNPFNPQTQFGVSLRRGQEVRVSVFDALGREVTVLHTGRLAAGRHTFVVDGAEWPSGLYVYEVRGEGFRELRSVMLVK